MTTFFTKKIKCANCGEINELRVIGSTSTFGESSLDLRPAPPARYVLAYEIEYCKKCGYASYDISKIDEEEQKIVNSEEYQNNMRFVGYNEPTRAFVAAGFIKRKKGEYHKAWRYFLKSAWLYDDEGMEEAAKSSREIAISYLEKADQKKLTIDDCAVCVDMLRRTGQFEKATKMAKEFLEIEDMEEILKKVMEFQIKLCEKKSTKSYSIKEIDWPTIA